MSVKKEGMIVVAMLSVLTLTAATTVPATLASLEMGENAWVCVCLYTSHTHLVCGCVYRYSGTSLDYPNLGGKRNREREIFLL